MSAADLQEAENAVSRWRESIEECERLRAIIAVKDENYNELRRICDAGLFEADRLKSLNEILRGEQSYLTRKNAALESGLEAMARAADDAARLLVSISESSLKVADRDPTRLPQIEPESEKGAPEIERPVASLAAKLHETKLPPIDLDLEPVDVPLFLKNGERKS